MKVLGKVGICGTEGKEKKCMQGLIRKAEGSRPLGRPGRRLNIS
jgi:hypothetical protein